MKNADSAVNAGSPSGDGGGGSGGGSSESSSTADSGSSGGKGTNKNTGGAVRAFGKALQIGQAVSNATKYKDEKQGGGVRSDIGNLVAAGVEAVASRGGGNGGGGGNGRQRSNNSGGSDEDADGGGDGGGGSDSNGSDGRSLTKTGGREKITSSTARAMDIGKSIGNLTNYKDKQQRGGGFRQTVADVSQNDKNQGTPEANSALEDQTKETRKASAAANDAQGETSRLSEIIQKREAERKNAPDNINI